MSLDPLRIKCQDRIKQADYDTLVYSAKNTLMDLLGFLDLEWDPLVLAHSSRLTGSRPGESTTQRSIDTSSVSKWKSLLSDAEVQIITDLVEKHASDMSTGLQPDEPV